MKRYAIAILAAVLPFMPLVPAYAQFPPDELPFIAEINWAGSEKSTADEWIRLWNPSNGSVDVGGWILTGSATGGGALELASGTIIAPNAGLLIANYPAFHANSVLTESPSLVTTSVSLPNKNAQYLLANPLGEVVDQVEYVNPPAGSTNPFLPMHRLFRTMEWQTGFFLGGAVESVENVQVVEEVEVVQNVIDVQEIEVVEEELIVEDVQIVQEVEVVESVQDVESVEEITEPLNTESIQEPISEIEESLPIIEEPLPEQLASSEIATPPQPEPIEQIEQNSEPIPEPVPIIPSFPAKAILINEFMSAPKDAPEWIELYNPGPELIDLTDWYVVDESQKKTILSGYISINQFAVIQNPLGKLNNDKDRIALFDPSHNLIDEVIYGAEIKAPKSAATIGRNQEGEWQATSEPTPNAPNVFPELTLEPTLDLTITPYEQNTKTDSSSPAKQNVNATQSSVLQNAPSPKATNSPNVSKAPTPVHHIVAVAKPTTMATTAKTTSTTAKKTPTTKSSAVKTITIEGVITAIPGIFGTQIAYMSGTELYMNSALWPKLEHGDTVRVTGTPSDSITHRLKISSASAITILRSSPLAATPITSKELAQQPIGSLVALTGALQEKNGVNAVFGDSAGTFTASATKQSGVSWKNSAGSFTVVGIVREVNGAKVIFPRSPEDVTEEEPKELAPAITGITAGSIAPTKPSSWPVAGGALLALFLGLMTYWFARDRYPQLILKNS